MDKMRTPDLIIQEAQEAIKEIIDLITDLAEKSCFDDNYYEVIEEMHINIAKIRRAMNV